MTAAGPIDVDAWDLFCRVVDNFGDIGIGWRLAKQLAVERCRAVRLIVDDLDAFARIEPRVDPGEDRQSVDDIAIVRRAAFERDDLAAEPAAVVIELLGCGLPLRYLDAMAATRGPPPVWIDFEHLSAESWVAGFHGRPSPHPRLPLVKHFFYPGFDADTGGLLVEADIGWSIGLPSSDAGEARASLFAYPGAPIDGLARALADDPDHAWSLVMPDATATTATVRDAGGVSLTTIPFTDQDGYDRLLRSCDFNVVRGEDSFVRAQLAGRPFVWQVYRQADDAHLPKLAAFADRYASGLSIDARRAHRRLWTAWNQRPDDIAEATRAWLRALPELRAHAVAWRVSSIAASPLVARLTAFVDGRRPARRDGTGLLD